MIRQDEESKLYIATLNGRISGGHATAPVAWAAVVSAEIYSLGKIDPKTGDYTPPDVATVQAWAVDAVNQHAGELRREHFTDITAQDSVYLDKEAEARRCLADAAPTAEGYPYTDIERGIIEAALGQPCDLHTAAGFIVQVADEKRALSVVIEAQRRQAGEQVKAAGTVAEIEAILAGLG